MTSWVACTGATTSQDMLTGAALIVYVPAGMPLRTLLAETSALYPAGPATVTEPATPWGRPSNWTLRAVPADEYETSTATGWADGVMVTCLLFGVGTKTEPCDTFDAATVYTPGDRLPSTVDHDVTDWEYSPGPVTIRIAFSPSGSPLTLIAMDPVAI